MSSADRVNELKVRIERTMDIYHGSSGVQATYSDLALIYSDILELIELIEKKKLGFN